MIDFTRAMLTHVIIHQIGNKGLGEVLTPSSELINFKDDFVKETLLRYCLGPFQKTGDIYHRFKGKIDITLNSVANCAEDIFKSQVDFINQSQKIAEHLYNQGMHPKIASGALYVCFFKDAMCDGELLDCLGLFKTEKHETFLKLIESGVNTDLDCETGVNVQKLDKGCLIFNTQKNKGYKLSIIDINNKVSECALYWQEDFLNAKITPNSYYHTKNILDATKGFIEETLAEANVPDLERSDLLRKSVSYFNEHEKYIESEFEREVLQSIDRQEAFRDYVKDYNKRMDLLTAPEFDISATAVKANKKYLRSVVKLDKNFHVYIHSNIELIEEGFDEEKGKKFMKLYYVNKE